MKILSLLPPYILLFLICVGCTGSQEPGGYGRIMARGEGDTELTLRLTPLTDSDNATECPSSKWDSAAEWVVGDYLLEAFAGQEDTEGWDNPYYYGKTTFTVAPDCLNTATVTACQQKAIVEVNYSDTFSDYMLSYVAHVNDYDYLPTERRTLYLRPQYVTVTVDYTLPTGKAGSFRAATFQAENSTHYKVLVDLNSGHAGNASIAVSVNDQMQQEVVDVEL